MSGRILVVGDLQRTSGWEFWREQNDRERSLIVRQLAAVNPSLLILLGDLVSNGNSDSQWEHFDDLMAPVLQASTPTMTVAGNHDYGFWGGSSVEPLLHRFPMMEGRTSNWMVFGKLGLLFLDSNKDRMGAQVWEAQCRWYEQLLARWDERSDVAGVLVFLHHPPYTNSTVTSDEVHVHEAFVPAFMRARKTMAMFSGHVHSYERFVYGGKTFLVSGGGGGPRARLLPEGRKRHDDLYHGPQIRPFHYLSLTAHTAGVDVEVVGLGKGEEVFHVMEAFALLFPS